MVWRKTPSRGLGEGSVGRNASCASIRRDPRSNLQSPHKKPNVAIHTCNLIVVGLDGCQPSYHLLQGKYTLSHACRHHHTYIYHRERGKEEREEPGLLKSRESWVWISKGFVNLEKQTNKKSWTLTGQMGFKFSNAWSINSHWILGDRTLVTYEERDRQAIGAQLKDPCDLRFGSRAWPHSFFLSI